MKRYRTKRERKRLARRKVIRQKQHRLVAPEDKKTIIRLTVLGMDSRVGNASLVRYSMGVESIQRQLNDGTLHLKGSQMLDGSSKKKASEANPRNPQLPAKRRLHGFPTRGKPRPNRKVGKAVQLVGTPWIEYERIEESIVTGSVDFTPVIAKLSQVRESVRNSSSQSRCDMRCGMMSLDKHPAWYANELIDGEPCPTTL